MAFDIEQIKADVSQVISYSQDIPIPKADELINNWARAKSYFIKQMGDNLIYEYPEVVQLNLSNKLKEKEFSHFVEVVTNLYANKELTKFIVDNEAGFFNNEVVTESRVRGNENTAIIPVGMKLLKAFKYFIEDKDDLYYIQNYASSIIQKDKVEGKLCISVHPLDFLSSSENNHNWRSCHALDGEFRAGNLSYMLDSTTLICYLKSEGEDVALDNFGGVKWNNKKWRMLLFVSNDRNIIFAGRQYPFQSECALDYIKKYLFPYLGVMSSDYADWDNRTIEDFCPTEDILEDTYIKIGSKLFNKFQIIKNGSELHYNDLISSTCYKPYYTYNTLRWYPSDSIPDPLVIGNRVKCLSCGEHYITDSEWMTCDYCHDSDNYFYCEECGGRFYYDEDEVVYMSDGTQLCQSCFNKVGAYCERCGEPQFEQDLIYDGETGLGYCHYCWNMDKGVE